MSSIPFSHYLCQSLKRYGVFFAGKQIECCLSLFYKWAAGKESKGKVYITNASQITLSNIQTQMRGEAEKEGFQTEDDVVAYIKEYKQLVSASI